MRIFGPVLLYDLIRMARRSRYVLMRCLYALLLLGLLYVVYRHHFSLERLAFGRKPTLPSPFYNGYNSPPAPVITPQDLAEFGEAFFGWFMLAQLCTIVLLTPAYVAGAIAEEKQRRTLEYILATDLLNHEIVLGKLASRLANLTLFILAGLPVLCMTLLFGGVSPDLLWTGFAATAVTMVSLSAVSIYFSVYGKRPRDAITKSYLAVIAYFVVWGFLVLLQTVMRLDPPAPKPVLDGLDWVLWIYNTGNPIAVFVDLVKHVQTTGSLGDKPITLLASYSVFHLSLTALCVGWSIFRIRGVFQRHAFGGSKKTKTKKAKAVKVRKRPDVSNRPMIWKELYAEPGLRFGFWGQVFTIMITLACLSPGLAFAGSFVMDIVTGATSAFGTRPAMNVYARTVGTFVACLTILGVGIRAAGSIGAEKDRQTYETLMSSVISNREILFAKWLGAISSMKWFYYIVGIIWLMAAVSGGIHPLGLAGLLFIYLVALALAASLGLYFAASGRSTLRAVMATAVCLLFLGTAPWVGAKLDDTFGEMASIGCRSFSPAAGLTHLAFPFLKGERDFEDTLWPVNNRDRLGSHLTGNALPILQRSSFVAAHLLYALLAYVIYRLAFRDFRNNCGRIWRRPKMTRPPVNQLTAANG